MAHVSAMSAVSYTHHELILLNMSELQLYFSCKNHLYVIIVFENITNTSHNVHILIYNGFYVIFITFLIGPILTFVFYKMTATDLNLIHSVWGVKLLQISSSLE